MADVLVAGFESGYDAMKSPQLILKEENSWAFFLRHLYFSFLHVRDARQSYLGFFRQQLGDIGKFSGYPYKTFSQKGKERIDSAVSRTVREYGELLKLLGKE